MSLLRSFTGLILGMIATPIILKYIGEERFGTLRVLLDWLSHLSLAEMGLGVAITAMMAQSLGQDRERLYSVLKMGLKKYRNIFFIQIAALLVFCIFFDRLVPVSPELQGEAWISFLILAFSVVFIFTQVARAYLEAAQKGYIVNVILVIQNLVYIAAALLLLYMGYSLPGQAAAYSLSLLLSAILYGVICRREIVKMASAPSTEIDLSGFRQQRKSLFIAEASGRAAMLSDNLIITFVLGVKYVTAFFLTQKLIQIVQQQLQHVSNSSWPALADLFYRGEVATFRLRLLQLTEVTALFSGAALSVMIIFNPSFIILWTGESTFAGTMVSNIAAINGGFFAITSLWSWCFSTTRKMEKLAPVYVIQALVTVTLSISLTYVIGVTGPLWATLVGYITVSIWWQASLLQKEFEIPFLELCRAWLLPFAIPVSLTLIATDTAGFPQITSWWSLFALMVMSGVLFVLPAYFLLVRKETQKFLLEKASTFKSWMS